MISVLHSFRLFSKYGIKMPDTNELTPPQPEDAQPIPVFSPAQPVPDDAQMMEKRVLSVLQEEERMDRYDSRV